MIALLAAAALTLPDVQLRDHENTPVALRALLPEGAPGLLVIARHRCTAACGLLLGRLERATRPLRADPLAAVVVSPDPSETPAQAARRRVEFLGAHAEHPEAWTFAVGDATQIDLLLRGLEISFGDGAPESEHPAGVFLLDAQGRVARALGALAGSDELARALVDVRAGRAAPLDTASAFTCRPLGDALERYWPRMQLAVRLFSLAVLLALATLLARLWHAELHPPPEEG